MDLRNNYNVCGDLYMMSTKTSILMILAGWAMEICEYMLYTSVCVHLCVNHSTVITQT